MKPILQAEGNRAYRDPACYYHNGLYHLFYTLSVLEGDDIYNRLAMRKSSDLLHWGDEHILTPKDAALNFCSPGNVLQKGNHFFLCLCSYPLPNGWQKRPYAEETARLYIMESEDLETFGSPCLLYVKGKDVSEKNMGRMIDPYIFEDKDEEGKYWILYKQNGMSMSYSYDLKNWAYVGHVDAGENACILIDHGEYVLFHSPANGIGIKRSDDLHNWRDEGLLPVFQTVPDWANGRLTAGFVMRKPEENGYLLFFHGSRKECQPEIHGGASIGLLQSSNLRDWKIL